MPIFLLLVPVISTLLGGVLAIRLRGYIALLMAVGAGLLLGAAFLDLLPEAIQIGLATGLSVANVLGLTLLSYLFFYATERGLEALGRHWRSTQSKVTLGRVGAGMLIFHSFRDGMAIGAAFAASHTAGYAVAFGIAAHDLGDGMNTILLTTGGRRPRRADYLFLSADASAPLAGGLLTAYWVLSPHASVVLLVLAAGFFLQMATGTFLPELRTEEGLRRFVVPAVLLGALLIYGTNVLMSRR